LFAIFNMQDPVRNRTMASMEMNAANMAEISAFGRDIF
jgi:hypothetical protein